MVLRIPRLQLTTVFRDRLGFALFCHLERFLPKIDMCIFSMKTTRMNTLPTLPEDCVRVILAYLTLADAIGLARTCTSLRYRIFCILGNKPSFHIFTSIVPSFRLLPHQATTISWMMAREASSDLAQGGIAALEMGLGKTIISIVHSLWNPVMIQGNKPVHDDDCCCICNDAVRSAKLQKCGHSSFCMDCVNKLPLVSETGEIRCPVCRVVTYAEKCVLTKYLVPHPLPTVIIVSLTLLTGWRQQFDQFFSEYVKGKKVMRLPVLFYHKTCIGEGKMNRITVKKLMKYKFVVTTTEVLVKAAKVCGATSKVEVLDERYNEKRIIGFRPPAPGILDSDTKGPCLLFELQFPRVFYDEIHTLANVKTMKAKACMAVSATYRWGLTGTLINNSHKDFYSILKLVGMKEPERMSMWKVRSFRWYNCERVILSMSVGNAGIVMPALVTRKITIRLSDMERLVYDKFRTRAVEMYQAYKSDTSTGTASDFCENTRCRQCCIASYLVTPESKGKVRSSNDVLSDETKEIVNWISSREGRSGKKSAKILAVLDIFRQIPDNEKIIVFTNYTSVFPLLIEAFRKEFPKDRIAKIDGTTGSDDRSKRVWHFQNTPSVRILLTNYRVGGMGLNLTAANHVICLEPWWSYGLTEQAKSRCWRYGQTKTVYTYHILVEDSVEDKILGIAEDKKRECDSVLSSAKMNTKMEKLDFARILGLPDDSTAL